MVSILKQTEVPDENNLKDTTNGDHETNVVGNAELHETSEPMVSCLQPEDLARHVADHMDEPLYQVAPAEGNRPCSIFNVEN